MITQSGKNYAFVSEVRLPQATEQLFAFFSDAHNLQAITPAFLQFNAELLRQGLTPDTGRS